MEKRKHKKKRNKLIIPVLTGIIFLVCMPAVPARADTVYRQMTPTEAYTFFGESIDCIYYSSTGYKHVSLVPSSNRNVYNLNGSVYGTDIPSWVESTSLQYVVYYANVTDYSQNPDYLGINLSPDVHFDNCNALRFCAAAYIGSYTVSSAAYNDSFVRIYGQTDLRYSNSAYIDNNIYPYMNIKRSGGNAFRVMPVWCDYTSDTLSQLSLVQIGFNGAVLDGGREIDVYLSCPLINDTAVGATGVVTGTTTNGSTGGNTEVNVNVDMTETNGILGSIWNAITSIPQSILNGLQSLFVPSEGFMDEQIADVQDSFAWYEDLQAVGNDLETVFGQETFNEAPIVTLHMSQARSAWYNGERSYMNEDDLVIDMGVFAPYRSSIHTAISILLWVFFLWRLFARLPDIIRGTGMMVVDSNNIANELDGRLDDAAQDVVNSSTKYFRG